MASAPTASAGSPPSAQVVGNAFVQQYYHILHHSPELVFRFYQEGSKLGRPGDGSGMIHVTSMQAINEKILSMDYGECIAEIKTVDAQESNNGGVLVLVTGYLTGKDNIKRGFTQSFFLATQDKGYFVLNDVFRYVGEAAHQQGNEEVANGVVDAPHSPELDLPQVQEEHVSDLAEAVEYEDEGVNEEEVYNPSEEHEDGSVVEDGWVVEDEVPVEEVINEVANNSSAVVSDLFSSVAQEGTTKKSYASIVKVAAPLQVPAPAPRTAPISIERQTPPVPAAAATTPEVLPPSTTAPETSAFQEAEVDGYSIYIKSLPLNATPAQLEEEFKKFGPIKPNGIQVRSHKQQGFCFGFVEFEVASAVQSAIEASPVIIGGRQAYVEEKRPSGSRVGTRVRFPLGRGGGPSGFRGDGIRGRGSYGGGRGYGRGDFNNRSDFGGWGGGRGGSFGRGELGYQRVDQTGTGGGRSAPPVSPRNGPFRVPASA